MATDSHITMLREISAAGDRGRTGALDVEWDGAHVTLFFMFGHPSHVVFETADGRHLVGEPALDAVVAELPDEFRVAPWRRAMVTDDTLHFTAEDLMGLFQRRNAPVESNGNVEEPPAPAVAPPPVETFVASLPPAAASAAPASTEQPPFGLKDFPLMPLATTLWTDAAANVIDLEPAVPRLPDSFIVLSGPTCQGAALIVGGRVTDAVWVNVAGGSLGDQAAHALMNSLEGTLTAYRADDPRLLSALPMLWRTPRLGAGLPGAWLHTEDIVAEIRTSGRTCALVVESADPGVALFSSGELIVVYTAGQRWPATSMAALRALLHEDGALVTVLGERADEAARTETGDALVPAATDEAGVDEPSAPSVAQPEGAAETAATEAVTAAPQADPIAEDVTEAAAQDEPTALEAEPDAEPAADPEAAAAPGAVALAEDDDLSSWTAQPKGRGRRGRGRQDHEVVEPVATAPAEEAAAADVKATAGEADTVDAPAAEAEEPSTAAHAEPPKELAGQGSADADAAGSEVDEFTHATPATAAADALHFEPAVFTIADLPTGRATPDDEAEVDADQTGMTGVEAREATEFVPARLDIDVDALRSELTDIATVWLGADDAAPVARAIGAARPGVDDFVSTIRAIGAMEIPGHESAVVRAMAREMHFRASEVLCGV